MIPSYSEAAKAAIPTLTYSSYKAFLFFEDKNSETFYEEIIKKITPKYKDVRVICLQGKDSILNHFNTSLNKRESQKSIYVLDKDFDDLLDKKLKNNKLLYLNRYSIENFLLEEDAFQKILAEEKPKEKNISVKLNYEKYLEEIKINLLKLSNLYLIAQEYLLDISNCSDPIQKYTKDDTPWILCDVKINAYFEDISALLIISGKVNSEEELENLLLKKNFRISSIDGVPGKQIVDLIRFYIGSIFKIRSLQRDSLCFRLAKNCEFKTLDTLGLRVKNLVEN